jgi:hypothetical protein
MLASVLLLAACTTTQGVTDRLGERYTGRHVDQFFISYGPPVSEYALSNGDKFYTWRSGMNSVTLPGSSNFSGSVSKYGQIQGSSSYTPPTTTPIICEIRFLAAADGTVKRIDITRDTWGWWEISRCAELLNRDFPFTFLPLHRDLTPSPASLSEERAREHAPTGATGFRGTISKK